MELKDLKKKAQKELEKEIKDLDDIIKKRQEMVNVLQSNFDDIDRFKPGNIIKTNGGYYLIADEPFVRGDMLKIPIRHHIYPIMNRFLGYHPSLNMNMSGVIDIAQVPLKDMNKVNIISVRDMFNEKKESIIIDKQKYIERLKSEIERYKEDIEDKTNKITTYKEEIERCKTYDFNKEFEVLLDEYLNSGKIEKNINNHENYDEGRRYTYNIISNKL